MPYKKQKINGYVFGTNTLSGPSLEFWSDAKIALIRELYNHPVLLQQLSEQFPDPAQAMENWPECLGTIAAYCNIILDGIYTHKELENLTATLFEVLVKARRVIISPTEITKEEIN